MNDGERNHDNEISTDDDVAAAIADLDHACRTGDSDRALELVARLRDGVSMPPCGSNQRRVEALMAITRAIAQSDDATELASWLQNVLETVTFEDPPDFGVLSAELQKLGVGYLKAHHAEHAELLLETSLRFGRQAGWTGAKAVELAKLVVEAGAEAGNIAIGLETLKTELGRANEIGLVGLGAKLEVLSTLLHYLPQVGQVDEAISYAEDLMSFRSAAVTQDLDSYLNTLFSMIIAYVYGERHEEAATTARLKTTGVLPRLADPEARDRLLILPLATSDALEKMGRIQDAERFLLALIEQCRDGEEHAISTHLTALHALADIYTRHASEDAAKPLIEERQKVEEETKRRARSDPQAAMGLVQRGVELRQNGDFGRAIECFEGAIEIFQQTLGESSWETLSTTVLLGSTQFQAGDRDNGGQTLSSCAGLVDQAPPEQQSQLVLQLAYAYNNCEDYPNAEAMAQRVLSNYAEKTPQSGDVALAATMLCANALHSQGRLEEALEYRKSTVELTAAQHGDRSEEVGLRLGDLALTLDSLGMHEDATKSYDRSFELIYQFELTS